MEPYHKIQTLYKRDTNGKIIDGQWSLPEFEYLEMAIWGWHEKIHGTNTRIIWNGTDVRIAGKTDTDQLPPEVIAMLKELFPTDKMAKQFDQPVCLYGEACHPRIHKESTLYGVPFILFDVKVGRWWLSAKDVRQIARDLDIEGAPIPWSGNLHEAIKMVREGFKSNFGDFTAEGLILRPLVDLFNRKGERIIAKIKHKDFQK